MLQRSLWLISATLLTGCAQLVPELANIIDSIEDTAVCIEVNEDAMLDENDVHIAVDIVKKAK